MKPDVVDRHKPSTLRQNSPCIYLCHFARGALSEWENTLPLQLGSEENVTTKEKRAELFYVVARGVAYSHRRAEGCCPCCCLVPCAVEAASVAWPSPWAGGFAKFASYCSLIKQRPVLCNCLQKCWQSVSADVDKSRRSAFRTSVLCSGIFSHPVSDRRGVSFCLCCWSLSMAFPARKLPLRGSPQLHAAVFGTRVFDVSNCLYPSPQDRTPGAHTPSPVWQTPAPPAVPSRREKFLGCFQVESASFLPVAGFQEDAGERGLSGRWCAAATSRITQQAQPVRSRPLTATREHWGEEGRGLHHLYCLLAKRYIGHIGKMCFLAAVISLLWYSPWCCLLH